MVKLSQIASDVKAEAEGVWLEYVPGFKVRVASTATKRFRDAMEAALAPYRELIRADQGKDKAERKFTDEMREKIVRGVMAEHVLLDWEGLEKADGTPDMRTKERALEMLSDPAMHRFEAWVGTAAGADEVFRAERLERDRKN